MYENHLYEDFNLFVSDILDHPSIHFSNHKLDLFQFNGNMKDDINDSNNDLTTLKREKIN